MRHTVKGAAAFAALCAGALALSPMAYATIPYTADDPAVTAVPGIISATRAEFGGGANHTVTADAAWIGRISGAARTQTSLESLASTKNAQGAGVKNVFVVEQMSTVDALTLAPLAKKLLLNVTDSDTTGVDVSGSSAVVYAKKDGLTSGALTSLGKYVDATPNFFMVGGAAKLSTAVDQQVGSSIYGEVKNESKADVVAAKTFRLDGADRYETAYLVSGLVIGGKGVWDAAAAYGKAVVLKADYDRAVREWMEADAKGEKLQKDVEAAQAAADAALDELAEKTPADVSADVETKRADLTTADKVLKAAQKAVEGCVKALGEDEKILADKCTTEEKASADAQVAYNAAIEAYLGVLLEEAKGKAMMPEVLKLQEKYEVLKKALKKATDDKNDNLKDKLHVATDNLAKAVEAGFTKDADKAADKVDCLKAGKTEDGSADVIACVGAGKTLVAAKRAAFVAAVDHAWRGYTGNVFFATGTDFADALTAGPAAAKVVAPILLTAGSSYMPTVRALGKGMNAKLIYAAGGPAAKAATDLVATKKYHSTIAMDGKALWVGKDRYETAYKLAVSFYLGKETPNSYNRDMALASGVVGADAVVAGVWCVNNINAGILLTRPGSLPTVTADYISFGDKATSQQGAVKNLVIFGGYDAVSHETAGVVWAKMGQ